jgi:hypothetical protein
MNRSNIYSSVGWLQPSCPRFPVSAEITVQVSSNNRDIGPADRPLRLSSQQIESATASLRCPGDELSAAPGTVKVHLQFNQGKAGFAVDVVGTKLPRLLDYRARRALTAIDSAARSS